MVGDYVRGGELNLSYPQINEKLLPHKKVGL